MFEVKEKPRMIENALLIGVQHPRTPFEEASALVDELASLVETLGIEAKHREIVRINSPKSRFLLGRGKTFEVISSAQRLHCECIVFDDDLSPAQQRNWEAESGLCVIDRREVILEIFAERAQTKEAVLQVDLARMEYSLPRLKRAWMHLGRQRGGGATQRGEGEAQIEIDQRLVRNRIARLRKDLSKVVKRRGLQRKQRLRVPTATAAIVGYTNTGKSSLLNRLTRSGVLVQDNLFATLDPTTRRLVLPSGQTVLLTDTVGFVGRLPHHLIEAFKATLEEAVVSDLLIHVIDTTSSQIDKQRETTFQILRELGAEDKPMVTVYNKIDLLGKEDFQEIQQWEREKAVYFSARTGQGEDELLASIDEFLESAIKSIELLIPHQRYDLVNRLHRFGCVKRESHLAEGVHIVGNIPKRISHQFSPFLLNGRESAFDAR